MDITTNDLKKLASRKLWSGEYTATDNFRKIEKHASVCFEDGALVAVTGPADDHESQLYAALFADAPAMLLEIAQLRARLKVAEKLAEAARPGQFMSIKHSEKLTAALAEWDALK